MSDQLPCETCGEETGHQDLCPEKDGDTIEYLKRQLAEAQEVNELLRKQAEGANELVAEIARMKQELAEASALVCIANDYLPDHWDMDCVPLHKIKEFVEKYEQSAPKERTCDCGVVYSTPNEVLMCGSLNHGEKQKHMQAQIDRETLECELGYAKAEIEVLTQQVTDMGDSIANLFEQVIKCNFVDDHGHALINNRRMIEMAKVLEQIIEYRRANNGKEKGEEGSEETQSEAGEEGEV